MLHKKKSSKMNSCHERTGCGLMCLKNKVVSDSLVELSSWTFYVVYTFVKVKSIYNGIVGVTIKFITFLMI